MDADPDRFGPDPRGDEGAAMLEYGLLAALIAVVAAVGAEALGNAAKALYMTAAALF